MAKQPTGPRSRRRAPEEDAPAACWLCESKGAIAKHVAASEQFGKTMFVPHRPESASHPVYACPACRVTPTGVAQRVSDEPARVVLITLAVVLPAECADVDVSEIVPLGVKCEGWSEDTELTDFIEVKVQETKLVMT